MCKRLKTVTLTAGLVMVLCLGGCGQKEVSESKTETVVETVQETKKSEKLSDYLKGLADVYIEEGSTKIDYLSGLSFDKKKISSIEVDASKVNTKQAGVYTLRYILNGIRENGKSSSETVTAKVFVIKSEEAQKLADAGVAVDTDEGVKKNSKGEEVVRVTSTQNSSNSVSGGNSSLVVATNTGVANSSTNSGSNAGSSSNTGSGSSIGSGSSTGSGNTNTTTTKPSSGSNTTTKPSGSSTNNSNTGNTNQGTSKPNTSTDKENNSSSNSNTSSKPSETKPSTPSTPVETKPSTPSTPSKPSETQHVHTWEDKYELIRHDEVSHMETRVVQEAWTEENEVPVYDYVRYDVCPTCGWEGPGGSGYNHIYETEHGNFYGDYRYEQVGTEIEYIYHEAVTEEVKVVDQEAYTESIYVGTYCTECGAEK